VIFSDIASIVLHSVKIICRKPTLQLINKYICAKKSPQNTMEKKLLLFTCLLLTIFTAYSKNLAKDSTQTDNTPTIFNTSLSKIPLIQGNWFTADNNLLVAGFYEKKVFWDGKFYEYGPISCKKGKATIELTSADSKVLKLSVKSKKETLSISDGTLEYEILNQSPDYTFMDDTDFKSDYTADSITISGYCEGATPIFFKNAAILINDPIIAIQKIYPVTVSLDGLFRIRVPLSFPGLITFSNRLPVPSQSLQTFMAEPGDNIILTYRNNDENSAVFAGDNARFNNELYKLMLNAQTDFRMRLEASRYLKNLEGFNTQHNQEFNDLYKNLADYQVKHPSKKLDTFLKLYLPFVEKSDLINWVLNHPESMSEMEFLPSPTDSMFYQNPMAIYTPSYSEFIDRSYDLLSEDIKQNQGKFYLYLRESGVAECPELTIMGRLDSMKTAIKSSEDNEKYQAYKTETDPMIAAFMKKYAKENQLFFMYLYENAETKYGNPEGFSKEFALIRSQGKHLSNMNAEQRKNILLMLENMVKNDLLQKYVKALKDK